MKLNTNETETTFFYIKICISRVSEEDKTLGTDSWSRPLLWWISGPDDKGLCVISNPDLEVAAVNSLSTAGCVFAHRRIKAQKYKEVIFILLTNNSSSGFYFD